MPGNCSVGKASLQKSSMASTPLPKAKSKRIAQEDQGPTPGHSFSQVVEDRRPKKGHSIEGTKQDHGHDRRKSVRVGGPLRGQNSPREVEHGGPTPPNQLARTEGHSPGPAKILNTPVREPCASPDGQRNSKGTCKQAGRDQVNSANEGSQGAGPMGRTAPGFTQGGTHIGGREPAGGLPQQINSRPRRVEPGPGTVRGNCGQVRPALPGPLRVCNKHADSTFLFQVPDTGSGGDGRAKKQLAPGAAVRLSSSAPNTGNNSQIDSGGGGGDTNCPTLAETPLVRRPSRSLNLASVETSSESGIPEPGETPTPRPSMAPTSRLALEREGLSRKAFSEEVISVIQDARRPSTNRIYDATWRNFSSWCNRRGLEPLTVTIPDILQYLWDGMVRGLATNTIRRQVAALQTVLVCEDRRPLSQNPAVSAFLRGAATRRPPVVHRFPSWDLHKVLQALTEAPFEPLGASSLRFLTMKVAFLVAITSARRISELGALSVRPDLITFAEGRVTLRLDPTFIPKVNTWFHRAQEVILPDFCPNPSNHRERQWHTLDVRRALGHYVNRTASYRRSEALFVSYQPSSKGRKVTSSTIGRWIRACIAKAYESLDLQVPSNITAHSTRSAATSAAWRTQAPLEEICRAATWASPSSFVRNYKIDQFAAAEGAFGRRSLQQIVES